MSFIKPDRRHSAAFSIIESWFAVGIASVLLAAVTSFSLYTGRSFAGLSNYVDLEQRTQSALDQMTKDIRQTQYLTAYNSNITVKELVFQDWDGTPLTYSYSVPNRTLTRSKNGTNNVLLKECDYLDFTTLQRNPIGGSYDQFTNSVATNTKVISVTWLCSRQITGTRLNTESVQTAKIVIRKQ